VSANGQPLLYDGNGNLRSEGPRQFTFNARDQMIGGTNGAHTLTLAYDALDRVAVRTVDGQARRCVYDGADLIAEYNQAGTLLRRFVHGVGTDDPIRMTTGAGAHYYYHRDHMGSVIALSDAAGTAVEVYAYSPFGEPTSTGTRGNPFFFAGRIYEQGVARYDYRARHYAPGLGRFVSPDRVGFSGGDMNLYGYCVNSPLMYTDPSGEIMLVPIIVGGVAIVTLVTGYFIDHIESKTDPGGQEAANYGPYIVVGPTWKNQNPVVRESMLIHERKHKYSFHGVQRIWRNEASTELAAYKAQYEYLIKQRNLAEQKGDAATVDAINAYMQSALIETAVTDPSFLPNLYQGQSTIGGIWNAYIEGKQRELESGYPMMLD
jgi:RHS repeat-associated protein